MGDLILNPEVQDCLSLIVTPTSGPVNIFLEMLTHPEEETEHQMKGGG